MKKKKDLVPEKAYIVVVHEGWEPRKEGGLNEAAESQTEVNELRKRLQKHKEYQQYRTFKVKSPLKIFNIYHL